MRFARSRLLHGYDMSAGRLWSLVPVTISVAPLSVKRIARRIHPAHMGKALPAWRSIDVAATSRTAPIRPIIVLSPGEPS